jgi:hypothetical protein
MGRNRNKRSTERRNRNVRFVRVLIGLGAIAALALIPGATSAGQNSDATKGSSGAGSTASNSFAGTAKASGSIAAEQEDSLAAAARRAREERKHEAKPAKVFTNDNIPAGGGGVSTVGSESSGAPTADDKTKATGAAQGEKYWREKFAALNKKLQQDQDELAVMQRELGQLNLQDYSDPVKAMQQGYSRSDIDQKTAAIAAKQKDIEADKQAIADTQEQMRQAGGDAGWAR